MNIKIVKTTLLSTFLLVALSACKKKSSTSSTPSANTSNAQTIDCSKKEITTNTVWLDRGEGIDYIVNCTIEIKSSGSLTISPGVTVQFTNGEAGILASEGYLNAVGTADKPIVFQGKNGIKGEWKGIYIFSNNSSNILNNVTIKDAGSEAWDYDLMPAGLTLANYDGTARASLLNSKLQNNSGYGMYLRDFNENIFEFSNNTIDNNSSYPIRLFFDQLGKLDVNTDYGKTNGNNFIDLNGSQSINTALTIKKLNVPYFVNDYFNYFDFKQTVTINAGVTMVMEADYLIEVSGTMIVQGTSTNPVTFKGLNENTKGTWRGIVLRNNNNNSFTNTIFDGGGSSTISYAAKANLCIGETLGSIGKATLTNCTFKNSDGYGYAKKSTATVTESGSTFTNNTSGNIGSY